MLGRTLGHYRILAKIGAGGMGEVYSAHDERLERDVALKILPPGMLADEAARKRFRKEALALSKLNHANIATIYDFDTDSGFDFLAMEFVAGETLAKELEAGALAEKELAALGAQIAEALEEAHEHGIVHRDLKPTNIMVTPKGRVKVLDFGLAILTHPAGSVMSAETLSKTTGVAGTVPYMAPEQLQGERVDARTDIFSAGVVLYEMATGQRPFREELLSRLTDAILHQPPVAPRVQNPRISSELERIILKCLEKDPGLRYQSAKDLNVDLRRLSAPTAATIALPPAHPRKRWIPIVAVTAAGCGAALILLLVGLNVGGWWDKLSGKGSAHKIESLAVLPLANLSADPAQDYFADGMTEELTTELAQISGLRVISRTSAIRYKGSRERLPQIAKELGVDAVVEGSVERSGDDVRITAQLINAPNDTHLWARSYQRNLKDVLAMQDEVARAIAAEIQVHITPQEQARFERSRVVIPEAYEAYLRGRHYRESHTPDALQKAIAEFQRAIALDPSYAIAYSGLSATYHILTFNADADPKEVLPKSKEAALKAIELDPELGEAHAYLALNLGQFDWDWAGAEREYRRAIELSPNSSGAHADFAELLSDLKRDSEAIAQAERARELDPISPEILFLRARAFFYGRQYDRAVREFNDSFEVGPNFWPAHLFLGELYEQQGRYPDAISELRKAEGPTLQATSTIGYVLAVSGRKQEARQILSGLISRSKQRYIPPVYVARVYFALGEKDQGFAWLEKAYSARDSQLEFLAGDPLYDPVRSEARFQDLVRRVHLPE